MASYQIGDTIVFMGAFYDINASGGEDGLINPTTPRLIIIDNTGTQVSGSPFTMTAITAAHTGVFHYAWDTTGLGATTYAYVIVDSTVTTDAIVHTSGVLKLENNDLDSVDSAVDTNTVHLTDIKGAGWVSTDTLEIIKANTDQVVTDTSDILTDLGEIKGGTFNPSTDALEDISFELGNIRGGSFVSGTDSLEAASAKLDDIQGAGFATGTDSLKILRDELDTKPTAAQAADAVLDELVSEHQTAGSFGEAISLAAGVGTGTIYVDHDTGGGDNLAYKVGGVGINGADIYAYLESDWTGGNRSPSYVKAHDTTDANGRWQKGMYLAAGDYVFVFYRRAQGALAEYGPDVSATITVS